MEAAGVRGVALSWFRCFLTGREQRVRVGKCLSEPLPVTAGVPQGSIQLSLTDATECGSTGSNMNIRPGLKK
ncbi:hypothetical protein J6590_107702 [Homalodisca vitripennis]|nr:hypothetical protein J6590_107702 [Homalodisca vitripennis]